MVLVLAKFTLRQHAGLQKRIRKTHADQDLFLSFYTNLCNHKSSVCTNVSIEKSKRYGVAMYNTIQPCYSDLSLLRTLVINIMMMMVMIIMLLMMLIIIVIMMTVMMVVIDIHRAYPLWYYINIPIIRIYVWYLYVKYLSSQNIDSISSSTTSL